MEQNMNIEWVKKVREAKTSAELMALAKENGMDLTEDEAAKLFDILSQGAQAAHDGAEQMSEEDLAKVSGGWVLDKTLNLLDDEVFQQQWKAITNELSERRLEDIILYQDEAMLNVERLIEERNRQLWCLSERKARVERWY